MGGQNNCKIVLDILQKPPGFHTTAREPKRAVGTDASNTTKIPREDPQRERERKKSENGSGRWKNDEILGCPAEGGPAEGPRRVSPQTVGPRKVEARRAQAQT